MRKTVALNDIGLRIGEGHPNAKLSDADVEEIRQLHDEGMSYRAISQRFRVSRWTVGRICRYERRAQTPMGFRVVHVAEPE